MSLPSLAEALASVPDPRGRRGRRHPLPAVLGLVTLGLLMGRKSLEGIAELGRTFGPPLAHALGFTRGKTPTKSTLSRTLRRLDADAVENALARWVEPRLPPEVDHLALDGKTLKGSRDGEVPGQHLVSAYAPHVQAVVAQMRVDSKTNEHKAALRLLGILPVKGKVISGDAMFCQRDFCQEVIDRGGDYLLTVKANQPGLETDIAAGLAYEMAARSLAAAFSPEAAEAVPPGRVVTTVEKGHGRLEKRTIRVTTILTLQQKWPGLAQGFEITRERTEKGKKTVEVVYGMTSLNPEKADAKRLLELSRQHWGIENGSHYVRDVTLGEDACAVKKGAAPQVLAALRNAVVHLVSGVAKACESVISRAAVIRRLGCRPDEALQLLEFPTL